MLHQRSYNWSWNSIKQTLSHCLFCTGMSVFKCDINGTSPFWHENAHGAPNIDANVGIPRILRTDGAWNMYICVGSHALEEKLALKELTSVAKDGKRHIWLMLLAWICVDCRGRYRCAYLSPYSTYIYCAQVSSLWVCEEHYHYRYEYDGRWDALPNTSTLCDLHFLMAVVSFVS